MKGYFNPLKLKNTGENPTNSNNDASVNKHNTQQCAHFIMWSSGEASTGQAVQHEAMVVPKHDQTKFKKKKTFQIYFKKEDVEHETYPIKVVKFSLAILLEK